MPGIGYRRDVRGRRPSPVGVLGAVSAITIDPIVQYTAGTGWTFTARRISNISSAETHSFVLAGSSAYPPPALASDFGGSFPAGSISFTAGNATASFTVAANAAVQPE